MIPIASSLNKHIGQHSKDELSKTKLKGGTCYNLPKLNEARGLLTEKNKINNSSMESSLGSISKKLKSNKIYKQFKNKINRRMLRQNSIGTDQQYSVNDTVSIF
jgi:hypothetical protein